MMRTRSNNEAVCCLVSDGIIRGKTASIVAAASAGDEGVAAKVSRVF
jgi:hypothetical protein